MTVGQQANSTVMDQQLTSLSLQLRSCMDKLKRLSVQAGATGNISTWLQSIGYSPADATAAATLIGYFSNLQGVYYGTATVGSAFNFDNALSVLWGGDTMTS